MENLLWNIYQIKIIYIFWILGTWTLAVTKEKDNECPTNWVKAGKNCYRVFRFEDTINSDMTSTTTMLPSGDRSWKQARLNCMVQGSDLVSINSVVENHKIGMIKKMSGLEDKSYYWIGLSDAHSEGRFRWVDGSNITFSNWKIGEPSSFIPNNPRGLVEDYVVASGQNKWMDVNNYWSRYIDGCQEPTAYICEKPVKPEDKETQDEDILGLTKILGLVGSAGPPGEPGTKGDEGTPGMKGEPGARGPKGTDGKPGIAGPRGEKGDAGAVGATGPQGPHGPPGMIQVMDTLIGPDGPKGGIGDKGSPGEKGPPGLRGFKGDRGQTGPVGLMGQRGPKGDQGNPGNEGPKGEQGITGAPGVTGAPGIMGITGAPGATGPIGPRGSEGNKGDTGIQGPKGDIGSVGPLGPMGMRGPMGVQGRTGARGDKGGKGEMGNKGENGEKGGKGDRGNRGFLGPQGPKGERGFQGIKGSTGSNGEKGDRGEDGLNGLPGLPGLDGPEGPKGGRGHLGPQGMQGVPGPPGPPVASVDILPGEDEERSHSNNVQVFVNATAFCSGRKAGVYQHPLHCWQFLTCGATFKGDKEYSCYAGRRFIQNPPECKEDDTCVFGAPSVMNNNLNNEIRLAALAMKEGENHFAHRSAVQKLRANHSIYSAGMVVIFVLVAALGALVSRLYLTKNRQLTHPLMVNKQESRSSVVV